MLVKTPIQLSRHTEANKNNEDLFALTCDDDRYSSHPKGSIVICLEASDLGRKVSARDHAVIATRHADRKSMETNSICEIKNWDADEIYDLSSKDKIDLSNSRVVGIIKSTFNER